MLLRHFNDSVADTDVRMVVTESGRQRHLCRRKTAYTQAQGIDYYSVKAICKIKIQTEL